MNVSWSRLRWHINLSEADRIPGNKRHRLVIINGIQTTKAVVNQAATPEAVSNLLIYVSSQRTQPMREYVESVMYPLIGWCRLDVTSYDICIENYLALHVDCLL